MKLVEKLYCWVSDFASSMGVIVSKAATRTDSSEAMALLRPSVSVPMIRIGGTCDGSYAIPDVLEGITHCFSPGVGPSSAFEFNLAERGIQVLMADASVTGPAANHTMFRFRHDYVASFSETSRHLISMEDWVRSECGDRPADEMILQMDIEGDEYEVIHSMSEALLRRFRIIVVEFHHLNQVRHGIMCKYIRSAFQKLLKHFHICHVQENWAAGGFAVGGKRHSRLLEVTLVRKDRL